VFIPGGQLLFFEICFGISIFIYISFAKFVLQMQSFWAFLQRNMKKAKPYFLFRENSTNFILNKFSRGEVEGTYGMVARVCQASF